jgi:tyrosine-protein kinase Etk/Wzc
MVGTAEGRREIVEPDRNQETREEEESSIDYAALLRTLYCGRKTIIVVTLAACVIATAVALLAPRQFTSRASFIPPNNSSASVSAFMGQLSQLSGLGGGGMLGGPKSPGDLYVGILKSRSVESEIVNRFDLKKVYNVKRESQAENVLAYHSKFDAGLKDSIVSISVTDTSPARAQDLANAYLDALRETNGRLALSESSQRRLFYEQQLAKEKDALEDAEVDLKKTEEHSGLIAPAGQTAAEIQIISQTRAQIASKEMQLSALRLSATPQNPEIIRLETEISNLQDQLAKFHSGGGRGALGEIPTSKVPELELEYVRKEREVKYHEALFGMIARQYEAARMDESHQAPLLQVLDAASFPDAKSAPRRTLIVLGGTIFGCLSAVGWLLMRERIGKVREFISSSIAGQ